jgi:subtilase family serine protease
MRGRIASGCAGSVLIAGSLLTAGGAAAGGTPEALPAPVPLVQLVRGATFPKPPTTAQCEQEYGLACYAPFQYHQAYDLGPLYRKGLDGRGETIVIVDPFGYQFIRGELAVFDKAFNLPAPPSFRIIQPAGKVPKFNPKNGEMVGFGQETSLDVEYAHAVAPGASILLAETPVAEGLGTSGFPQIVKAENYVISHHLGTVISQSFGTAEQTFPSVASLLALRSAYQNAAAHGVSVMSATGDKGATAYRTNTGLFLYRVADWPASDPLVTAVGGTQMHLNASGQHLQPDTVWNDTNLAGAPSAGSGGRSVIFRRPAYQDAVAGPVGLYRGIPDISMSAAVDGAALVYLDARLNHIAGFSLSGGTSEAAPLMAGIVAIADQYAGHGLGLINPALYRMYAAHAPGLVDVTAGTDTVTFLQGGAEHSVLGFDAVAGYDLASGTGTVNAALFVPELAAAAAGRTPAGSSPTPASRPSAPASTAPGPRLPIVAGGTPLAG